MSRRLLWCVLSLAALPLFFEATTGCDVVFGLERPPDDNALQCACTCQGAAIPSTLEIRAGSDDAEQTGASMDLASTDLDLGDRVVGVRFDNVAIPPGAKIAKAYVQFSSDETVNTTTSLAIFAEASVSAPTFSGADNDLTNRTPGSASVSWNVPAWTVDDALDAQRTPDLKDVLQELVDLPGWTTGSSVVLRILGTGHRAAESFDGDATHAARLVVSLDTSVIATLPVCAQNSGAGPLSPAALIGECALLSDTLNGLNQACGYPTPCSCSLVDVPGQDDSFNSDVCVDPCTETPLADMCANFDPNAFQACVDEGGTVEDCKSFVAATNVMGESKVCVASGSPLAFQLFGRRSQCDVDGSAEIEVGDREPKRDPSTAGTVEFLGGPCPGGGCSVHPYFNLRMEPITFSVRWASDPTFSDLSASGRGLESAPLDGSGLATFAADTIAGTGAGRRGGDGLAVDSTNGSPLDVGIDWVARSCTMEGNLAANVGDDGVCENDANIPCRADSPDCDAVGGACMFPDVDEMQVDVHLTGQLVNQPPAAVAGANQTVECTSPAGASFTLDGSGSSDPDQNLALASWREGSRVGPELSNGLTTVQALGIGDSEHYVLRVIDGFAQADEAETAVTVADTTPPELSISVTPVTLWPPNHTLRTVTVSVTTSDICDTSPSIRLISIVSNEPDNGLGDGDTSQDVQGALLGSDDRQFQLRAERSGKGSGRIYTITYEAADDSGNVTVRQTSVSVPHN